MLLPLLEQGLELLLLFELDQQLLLVAVVSVGCADPSLES